MGFRENLEKARDKIENVRDKFASARLKRGATKLKYLKKQRIRSEGLGLQKKLIEKEKGRISKANTTTTRHNRKGTATHKRKVRKSLVFVSEPKKRKKKTKKSDRWDLNNTPSWLR